VQDRRPLVEPVHAAVGALVDSQSGGSEPLLSRCGWADLRHNIRLSRASKIGKHRGYDSPGAGTGSGCAHQHTAPVSGSMRIGLLNTGRTAPGRTSDHVGGGESSNG